MTWIRAGAEKIDPNRCWTEVTLIRADRLALGDRVLVSQWTGEPALWKITGLNIIGDDVDITFMESEGGTVTTSIGNTFQVVTQRKD